MKNTNGFRVNVERDSVCMGDDVDSPHTYNFNISSDATLNNVFEHLAENHYLASVGGINHSWEAIIENRSLALFKGNNRKPEHTDALIENISSYTNSGVLSIYFKYNSATN
jgi:hypothetical protein